MMKTKTEKSKSKKSSGSLMLEILEWFGFRLKLAAAALHSDSRRWRLVWKSNDCTVFFVRHYDVLPFRRYESHFSLEKEKKKTKPKESLGSCFAEFLGSVEVFELEGRLEDGWWTKKSHDDGWLTNPFFGCKSLEEMAVKLDLLGERRKVESYGSK